MLLGGEPYEILSDPFFFLRNHAFILKSSYCWIISYNTFISKSYCFVKVNDIKAKFLKSEVFVGTAEIDQLQ